MPIDELLELRGIDGMVVFVAQGPRTGGEIDELVERGALGGGEDHGHVPFSSVRPRDRC
ncbi:Uncharacterised protein [Mycobacteroides abscessus subsp. abscessus]|nr:Uncharacterised protein [Mycobacteroides abscessus subsp. abscessus]